MMFHHWHPLFFFPHGLVMLIALVALLGIATAGEGDGARHFARGLLVAIIAFILLGLAGCETCREHQAACAVGAVVVGVAVGAELSHRPQHPPQDVDTCFAVGGRVRCNP